LLVAKERVVPLLTSLQIPTYKYAFPLHAVSVVTHAGVASHRDPSKRVVITGMGLVSCFGNDIDGFYNKLLDGVSGIDTISRCAHL
jgi:3-oxoacyl-[acyl-carrier-protein] synthase II